MDEKITLTEIIRRRFPEFTLIPDERIEIAIFESGIIMGEDYQRWFDYDTYTMARSYLIGHLIVIAEGASTGDDTAVSPIRRTTVDNVEVDYAVNTNYGFQDSELASTLYGRRFLFYRNMIFTGGIVV